MIGGFGGFGGLGFGIGLLGMGLDGLNDFKSKLLSPILKPSSLSISLSKCTNASYVISSARLNIV